MHNPVKVAIRQRINTLFNDYEAGERPVLRRTDALFAPDSVAWRVNGDVVTMMIGGVSGLLLQMLHPAVLAGVWDHSDFRTDMLGRLRRTAKFIAVTTYDHASAGQAAIDKVNRIHAKLKGTLPDGTPYRVTDPHLLTWVHATETLSFLNAWVRHAEPDMSQADQDQYFAEMAQIAEGLGADPIPRSRSETLALIDSYRPELRVDARTREVADMVMSQRVGAVFMDTAAGFIMQAGYDLQPDWARQMHGRPLRRIVTPVTQTGASVMARLIDWAYTGSPNREIWPDDVTVWPRG